MLLAQPTSYPFTAIVGQEKIKLALILNVVDPSIGGVLIRGVKGSGKSLTVRALEDILPKIEVSSGCEFNCNPKDPTNMCETCRNIFEQKGSLPIKKEKMKIIQLPLSATEDRVIGTFDLERAFKFGMKYLRPGILAEANQNILYVDEVNLLPDHIADDILDAAASGWNIVQREGVSVSHPSRFILIGTMNPEEGELRPQLLDRFALSVESETVKSSSDRADIIRRNIEYESDSMTLYNLFHKQQEEIQRKIESARRALPNVYMDEVMYEDIARMCANLQVHGHRPDIVIAKTAKALAAFLEKKEVLKEDVTVAYELALGHRLREIASEDPFRQQEPSSLLTADRIMKGARDTDVEIGNFQVKRTARRKESLQSAPTPIKGSVEGESKQEGKKHRLSPSSKPINTLFFTFILSLFYFLVLYTGAHAFRVIFSGYYRIEAGPFTAKTIWASIAIASLLAFLTLFFQNKPRQGLNIVPSDVFYRILLRRELNFKSPVKDLSEGYSIMGGSELVPSKLKDIGQKNKTLTKYGEKILRRLSMILRIREEPHSTLEFSVKGRHRKTKGQYFGKSAKTTLTKKRGRYVWYELPREPPWDLALGPTIRTAAPYQLERNQQNLSIKVKPHDFRVKVREYKAPHSIILLVDMSESMVNSMKNLARAILSIHASAYKNRDRLGLIVFKGSEAFVLQTPTRNLKLIARKLVNAGASDFTPLASGLLKALEVFKGEMRRDRNVIPLLVIITDGITNQSLKKKPLLSSREKFMNVAQADALDVARLIKKKGIKTLVINTNHREEEVGRRGTIGSTRPTTSLEWFTPTALLLEIADITSGRYYGLNLNEMPRDRYRTLGEAYTVDYGFHKPIK